jgi:iron complex outermembrane receptor protein
MTMLRDPNPHPSFHSIDPGRWSTIGLFFILVVALIPPAALAQTPVAVRGVVLAPTGEPVAGARIDITGEQPVITDENGRFHLELQAGDWELVVSHPAYRLLPHRVTVGTETVDLELRLDWVTSVEESVTVIGIRAGEDVPVTKRNIDREEIESFSFGQDVPQLLEHTPSMNWYSDSGIGDNYSYFTMRGIQQTRINMTFDGAPLNDPAEHALYFNNFHDFLSTVDSIQIQRGVGTSAVGSPAYGGSVNFASPGPSQDRGGDARLVLGSYDTARASIGYESGLFGNGLYVSGRFSYANTDGYREHSGSEHHTLFLNAGWQSDRSSLKLVAFSGDEKSQLAYLAVEPEILDQNRRFNPLTEEDRDEFGQDFAQLKYSRDLGGEKLLTASLYYNGAQGWFQLWDDPVAQNDLLRFGIDQGFIGSMVTLSTNTENLSATFGMHYNDFSGDHFLDTDANGRIYKNTGFKETANAFGKAEYRLGQTLLFGDLHLRWAQFSYEGDVDLGSVDWTFLDPKIGVRQTLSPGLSLYGSIGHAQREPARLDLLLGEDNATVPHDLEAVKPESVTNFEGGIDLNTEELALEANVYLMEFRDEIALTGELSEIGLPLRRNVDRSYRRGVEVDLRWMPLPNWTVVHSLNVSRNRIDSWTQFYDVYDAEGAWIGTKPITYRDVRPLLSPELIFNLGAEWANRDTSVRLMGRYVAESQLDNTGLSRFQTPSFTNLDLRASQSLGRFWEGAEARITLFVNNLLDDEDQLPSGYSYQFLVRDGATGETLDGIPYYYPLATRNFVVELEVGF